MVTTKVIKASLFSFLSIALRSVPISAQNSASVPQKQSKFDSGLLPSSLLLSAGIFLELVILIPVAEARIASNGTSFNGTALNDTKLKSGSSSTLQLEGSQLVLYLDR